MRTIWRGSHRRAGTNERLKKTLNTLAQTSSVIWIFHLQNVAYHTFAPLFVITKANYLLLDESLPYL